MEVLKSAKYKFLRAWMLVILLGVGFMASAQEHRKAFGQNRLQFKKFDWFYYSTDNFDIHYYNNGQEYAKLALEYLEKEYDNLTDILGYAPYAKTKIFLYNSPSDMLQSNIGVDGATFTIAGQTSFVKLQVEIAYPGSLSDFKEELHYKITKMLIEDMMFGGSLAEMFQSAYLLNLPQWFVKGASKYVAHGWNVEMDDYVRDYFKNSKDRKLTRIKNLEGEKAVLIGQSMWNFIALKYGESNISNVLNLTRIIRNVEHSIASTLGVPFNQFMAEWIEYYQKSNDMVINGYIEPREEEIIEGEGRKSINFKNVKFSPDGSKVVYSENLNGRYKLKIKDLTSGEETKLLTTGNNVINQDVDYDLPLVEWISDTKIGMVQNWYGFNYLLTYDLETKEKTRKSLLKFNQIKSISFHRNGKLAVISADVEAHNDLYLISLSRNAIKRLTRDKWDDFDPSFVPGSDAIVFSSNRPADSLDHKLSDIDESKKIFNLFLFDLDTTKNVLRRVTNTFGNDTKPMALDDKTIYFLSDQKGISNLYRYDLDNNLNYQVSSFSSSIIDYDIDARSKDITYLMRYKGNKRLFHTKNFILDKNSFSPQTLRNQLKQIEFLRKRREEQTIIEVIEAPKEKKPDPVDETGKKLVDTDYYVFDDDLSEEEVVNTESYEFEDEEEEEGDRDVSSFSFLSNYRKVQRKPTVTGPLPYETAISADNVITSFVMDPLRGFGILFETEMNDVLENHKFYGGFLSITDLRSGDFFAEYQFIKYKIDFHTRFDRKSFLIENSLGDQNNPIYDDVAQKYILNTYTVGASLPFSVNTRLKVSPFMAFTTFNNLNAEVISNRYAPTTPPAQDSRRVFAGLKSELIFDNALVNGLNLYEGTRAKLAFQTYGGITDGDKSFSNVTLDIRHYQKIYRELIFATRLYYGRSFGNNPKRYLLGGLDNWLFNRTDESSLDSGILDALNPNQTLDVPLSGSSPLNFNNQRDNSDVLFVEYVNLRGFNYNKLNGTNVLTFNAEMRVPIVKIFHRGSITSNFLRNFQFIGFYDLGSSWTGSSPFSDENDVGIKVIKPGAGNEDSRSPFEAVIRTSRSPWLASYGFGLRTVMLGYYMRFDFAKPIEDYSIGPMKFYLTLGYDF
ncbi:MAG: PD40 domain-containing protein [Cyclobacteriaceae bacterium]